MNKILFTILLAGFLISCSNTSDPNYDNDYNAISSLDLKSAIGLANEWKFSNSKIKSFINTSELVVEFPDGRIVKKSLPTEQFYVAIAPYTDMTHTCSIHYPSSCLGELTEKSLNVTVKSGTNELFKGNIISQNNGFIELWLPRDKEITVSIEYNSLKGEETISTAANSRTCITTINLK